MSIYSYLGVPEYGSVENPTTVGIGASNEQVAKMWQEAEENGLTKNKKEKLLKAIEKARKVNGFFVGGLLEEDIKWWSPKYPSKKFRNKIDYKFKQDQ